MSRISIKLSEDKTISDVLNSEYSDDNYIVVENNSEFLIEQKYLWTVRESDNALVHVDTNQTPEEERDTVISNLTLQNLQQANEITELKKISTTQTLQSLQDAKDKDEQQKVITNQTVQLLELQKSVFDIKAGTTTN